VIDPLGDPLHEFALLVKQLAQQNGGRLTDEILISAERSVRFDFAGCRVRIAKRLPKSCRWRLIHDDLGRGIPAAEVAKNHQVSLRTIYRLRQNGD